MLNGKAPLPNAAASFNAPTESFPSQTAFNPFCTPADIFVVIDQSASMANSDPRAMRLDAVRNLIDRLYLNAALRCPGTTYRIGVIGFGDQVQTMIELTDIRVNDIAEDDWQGAASRLKSNLQRLDLNQTNHANALVSEEAGVESVLWHLGMAQSLEQGDEERKRAVILVTDGMPCTPEALARNYCGSPNYVEQELYGPDPDSTYPAAVFSTPSGLITALNSKLPPSPRHPSLYVLLFSNNAAPWDFVDRAWATIAEQRDGRYIPPEAVDTNDKITAEIDRILSEVLETDYQPISCDAPFYLEPYISTTTIVSSIRPNDAIRLSITGPSGQTISGSGYSANEVDYNYGDSYERFVIRDPEPGRWTITVEGGTCSQIEATYETVEATAGFAGSIPTEVVVNLDPPYYVEGSNKVVEFDVRDSFGNPFIENPDYPLQICGKVEPVGNIPGMREKLDALGCMTFSQVRRGTWRADTPLPAPAQGVYKLTISASVQSVLPDAEEALALFTLPAEPASTINQYQTALPEPVSLEMVKPSGGFLPLNDYREGESFILPIEVQVQVVTDDSSPQPIQRVFYQNGLAENALEAVLYDDVGAVVESITLAPSVTNPNVLEGRLQADVSKQIDRPGMYSLQVRLTSDATRAYNADNYRFASDSALTSQFERRKRDGINLIAISPAADAQLWLNTIENGQALNEPIEVQARLQTPEGKPLALADIVSDASQIVKATLIDPTGAVMDSTYLSPIEIQPTSLRGILRAGSLNIDMPGIYTVRLTMDAVDYRSVEYDTSRYVFLNTGANASFERRQRYGVFLEAIRPAPEDSLELNRIEGNTQIGLPVDVAVRFVDPTIQIPVDPDEPSLGSRPQPYLDITPFVKSQYAEEGFVDLVYATIHAANGVDETIALSYNSADGIFTGQLRSDPRSIDPSGDYQIVFRANPDALDATAGAQYEMLFNKYETDWITFERKERVNLRLNAFGPADQFMLNTIEAGQAVNSPFEVSVEMTDQAGNPLAIDQVFGDGYNLNRLVQATIYHTSAEDGASAEIERIFLSPAGEGSAHFVGTLRAVVEGLDPAGTYTVKYTFADALSGPELDHTRYSYESPSAASKDFERLARQGVSVVLTEPSETWYWLNQIDDAQRVQIPNSVPIEVQLIDLEGHVYTSPEDFARLSLDNAFNASIEGPGISERARLTWDDVRHAFTGVLRAELDAIDPAGRYTVTVTIEDEFLSTDPLAQYELVVKSAAHTFERSEMRGVELELIAIGGEVLDQERAEETRLVPLYLTWQDAFGWPRFWNGPIEAAVPVEMVLRDTNGSNISWTELVDDPSASTLDSVVAIAFQVDEGESMPLHNLREAQNDNGSPIIIGEIDGQTKASGLYTLVYELKADALRADGSVYNFSSQPARTTFERTVAGLVRDPRTWVGVRVAAAVLLVLYALIWWIANRRYPMRGRIKVTYRDAPNSEREIPLSRIKWLRRRRQYKYKVNVGTGNDVREATVTVTVTSGAPSQNKQMGSGFGAGGFGGASPARGPVFPGADHPSKKVSAPKAPSGETTKGRMSYRVRAVATAGRGGTPQDVELFPGEKDSRGVFEIEHLP